MVQLRQDAQSVIGKRALLLTLLFALFLPASYAGEQSLVAATHTPDSPQPESRKTVQTLNSEVKAFVGNTQALPEMPGAEPVKDRLLSGFQQEPPRRLQLENNVTVYWGWQEGQAFIMSIAVYGPEGSVRMVGAVDDIPRLYSWRSNSGVVDEEEYQALLQKYANWGSVPSVVLFTQDADHLETYLPLVQRWLQAAMMGFHVDCSDPQTALSCNFAESVSLPMVAYKLNCDAGNPADTDDLCPLPLPDTQALPIPLKFFTQ